MRVSQIFLWAFVPWPVFWQQGGPLLKDHGSIRFGLSASSTCHQVDKIFHGVVALQAATQKYGLSHRTRPLSEADAMLFVNSKPKPMSFWMLQTYIPLDIAYYDSTGLLREVYYMPVEIDPSRPKTRYLSKTNIQVSIEMKPGAHHSLWSHPHLCVDSKS